MQEMTRVPPESAYGLKSLVEFAVQSKWFILFWGVLGLLLSIGYLYFAPKVYESKSQIRMAKFVSSISEGEKTSTIGRRYVNSETIATLMQRLRYVSTYPDGVLKHCGMEKTAVQADYLGGALQARPISGMENNLELIFRGGSPELAKECMEAVVSMIAEQQSQLIEDSVAGVRDLLKEYNEELRMVRSEEKKTKGEWRGTSLGGDDRAESLVEKIDGLREELVLAQKQPTKLLAPIVSSPTPASPVPARTIMLGIGLGLIFGLVLAWIKKEWMP